MSGKAFVILATLMISKVWSAQVDWLPRDVSFPIRYLDPAACQQGISLLSYEVEGDRQQVLYVPITLSMQQQFIRVNLANGQRLALGMNFSIFSQFSIVDVGEAYMGGLQNADYRVSAVGVYQPDNHSHVCVSLFHQSSHLGDDYIIRNAITSPTLRTQNYEQVDISLSRSWRTWRFYGGGGYNVSPNTIRSRSTLHLGAEFTRGLISHPGLALKGGWDANFHEQHDFNPNFRLGCGLEFGRLTDTPFVLMLTWYEGHLPYSTLEFQKVRLLGLSLFIDLMKKTHR